MEAPEDDEPEVEILFGDESSEPMQAATGPKGKAPEAARTRASEILSGAIQDNNRGVVVGKKTFGKGLIQSVRGLSDGSGMTVTIAKYLTPSGKDIHKLGITPDVNANLSKAQAQRLKFEDLGTRKDPQYRVAESELSKLLRQNNTKPEVSFDGLVKIMMEHDLAALDAG